MDELQLEVLWIDDEPSESFVDEAFEEGINITNCTCVNEGINLLNDDSRVWDAIILDANCKITGNEVEPDIEALYKGLRHLYKSQLNIPWFVYTAKSIDWSDNLRRAINDEERVWDDRDYYNKPSQRKDLFASIKKAAENKDNNSIRKKYASVCNFYKDADFLDLLVGFEKGGIETDSNIPNRVREVLDWIMEKLNNKCALPVLFNGTNLNECSVCLGMMTNFVPSHVQESFRFCVNIANEGSHKESRRLIRENKAPFLNKTLIGCLIDAMQWCATLSDDIESHKKESIESYTANPNIRRYGQITKSANGALQLKDCLVLNEKSLKVGDIVACVKYKNQDRYIKLAYF